MSTKPYPVTPRTLEAMEITKRGCEELLVEADWLQKLARSEATSKPLRIKLGLDPTAPDIHLGHTVVLNKLRQLQDLGGSTFAFSGGKSFRSSSSSGPSAAGFGAPSGGSLGSTR